MNFNEKGRKGWGKEERRRKEMNLLLKVTDQPEITLAVEPPTSEHS